VSTSGHADPSHRHLAYMLEDQFVKSERTYFNSLASSVSAVRYLEMRGLDIKRSRECPIWDARRGRGVQR
jgi:hypothetical protein